MVFLFSSTSFNDAIRRMNYVKQYRGYRADQAVKITSASVFRNIISSLNHEEDHVFHFDILANNDFTLFNSFNLEAIDDFFQIFGR